MIPKIIHYCWFGTNEMSQLQKDCIATWHKLLPEYSFMLWNQDNFDVTAYPFANQAYQAKNYAFVSDVCRLAVLKQYGGVYLDTDVELVSSLNPFLKHTAFCGFEDNLKLQTGVMASIAEGEWISDLLKLYEDRSFINSDGSYNIVTNVDVITAFVEKQGVLLNNCFQEREVAIYPSDFFCAKSHIDGKIALTANTVAIHHFAGSWLSKKEQRGRAFRQYFRRVLGTKRYFLLKRVLLFWKK